MNARGALNLLVDQFPFLAEPVDAYISRWARYSETDGEPWPGLYNLWGDVIFPTLVEPLLCSSVEDKPLLTILFDAIEKMAVDGDDYVETFVGVGICERLGDSPQWFARSQPYMGPRTREASDQVEVALGRRR